MVVVNQYGTSPITQDLRDLTFFPLTTNITPAAGSAATRPSCSWRSPPAPSWGNTNPNQIQQQDRGSRRDR